MATGTAPPPPPAPLPPAPPVGAAPGAAPERYIDEQLERTRRHIFWLDVGAGLLGWFVAVAGFLLLAAVWDHWIWPLSTAGRWFALATLATLTALAWWRWIVPPLLSRVNPAYAARVIEERGERLNNSLINYLYLRRERGAVAEGVFQSVERRAAGDLDRVPWEAVLDFTPTFRWAYVLAGLLAALAAYKIVSPKDPLRTVARVFAPWTELERPSRVELRDVRPGDVETFHGRPLEVSADVRGLRDGETAEVVFSTSDGQTVDRRVPLQPTPDGLRLAATIPPGSDGVRQDLRYRIEAGDATTRDYRVRVLAAPTISVERVELEPPRYTKLPRATFERQGDVRGVEGTRVTIRARASLPIKSAFIEFDPRTSAEAGEGRAARVLHMEVEPDGLVARQSFFLELKPDRSGPTHESYQVRFVTPEGTASEGAIVHSIAVQEDLAPEVEFLAPRQAEVTLPVDRLLPLEIRAIDPDFGVAKLTLRAERDGGVVFETHLVDEAAGVPGQVLAKYDVSPRKLQLQPGDEMTVRAEVEDNRADWKTGRAAPNRQRTEPIRVRIVAADAAREPADPARPDPTRPDPEATGAKPETPGENSTPPDGAKPRGDDERGPRRKPDSPSKPDEKPGAQDAGTEKPRDAGEPPGAGEKPNESPRSKPGEGSNEKPKEKTSPEADGKPNEKPNEKPSTKPTSKPGDGSQDSASGAGEKPGSKPGEATGEKPSEKPGSKPGEKPGGASGDMTGGGAAEKPMPKPGEATQETPGDSQSPQEKTGKTQPGSPKQGGESSSEKTGRPEQGKGSGGAAGGSSSKPTEPPAGADEGAAGEPSGASDSGGARGAESGSSPGRATGKPGSGNSSGRPSDDASGAGEPTGELHDGDVIQRALEHLKSKQGGAGKPTGQAGAEDAKPAGAPESGRPEGPGRKPQAGDPMPKPGDAPEGAAKPAGSEEQPGANVPGAKPGDQGTSSAKPKQDGRKPDGTGASAGDGAKQETGPGESGRPAGTAQTKPETPPSGAPRPKGASPGAGQGENGESGAGERPEKPNGGAPSPLEKPADRPKTQTPDGKQSAGGDETATPSESKQQSDSKGGAGGDRSGGGKQGGGQGAKQAGNDSAGSNSPGDDGAGAASETGRGPDGTRGGAGKPTSKPTGTPSGDQRGEGSTGGPGSGDRPQPNGAKPTNPPAGKPDGAQPPGAAGAPGSQGAPNGAVTGGGKAGGAPGGAPTPAGEVPEGDAANLDYARKSTDLVLDYLKDQQENPDRELLDKLGWSRDDLQRFLDRWQQLKDAADRNDPRAKRELDESLKSLGLRPGGARARGAGAAADAVRGNRDDGQRTRPPAKYLEQFKAYRKGTSSTEVQGK